MTLRETFDKFLSYSEHGAGGRGEEKKIKDKGEFKKGRAQRSVKGTHKDYDDVRLQVDDSDMNGTVGHAPSKLPQGF
jgi:hypothetical protein